MPTIRYESLEELLKSLSPDVTIEDAEELETLLSSTTIRRLTKQDNARIAKAIAKSQRRQFKRYTFWLFVGLCIGALACFLLSIAVTLLVCGVT